MKNLRLKNGLNGLKMIIANLSGGRDSSAMVVRFLELGNKIDYIIFCDTGHEFPEMYEYIDKLDSYIQRNFNHKLTRIDASKEIEKWAFEYPIQRGELKGKLRGLPFVNRKDYCTREAKINPTRKFIQSKCSEKYRVSALIGYTYNEVENGRTSNLDYAIARYPLHEWGWNEKEVSDYLSEKQIMNPLYNRFERTGCYFCPKQSKASLYNLWKFYPHLWQKMKDFEAKAKKLGCVNQTFKIKSILEYEKEFQSIQKFDFGDIYAEHETCFCGK